MIDKKTSISNKRRIAVKPKTQPGDTTNIEENNREIEGCHIIGNSLMFLITHSKTKDEKIKKDLQYICRVLKSDFTKDTKWQSKEIA